MTNKPHDALFKATFTPVEHARRIGQRIGQRIGHTIGGRGERERRAAHFRRVDRQAKWAGPGRVANRPPTLDHVMLTIIDLDNDSAYVLNNNNFIGPIENSRQAIDATLA